MKTLKKLIFLIASLLALSACSSSHISLIRIDTSMLEEALKSTDKSLTTLSEIESILGEVCNQHGLTHSLENNNEIKYTRYWGSANYKHPNTIYLSLNQDDSEKHILELSIFEWEAVQQTEFAEEFMAHLLREIKTLVPEREITIETL